MSNKPDEKEKTNNGLFKAQLLHESAFIRYCNDTYLGQDHKLNLTEKFLRAANKEELIKPLLQERVQEITPEGKKKVRTIKYYSPHQLFMVVGLRKNIIKGGKLSSDRKLMWGPAEYRSIVWGDSYHYSVFADSGKPVGSSLQIDVPNFANDFHNFVLLLHSQPRLEPYSFEQDERRRYFTLAPDARFNLKAVRKEGSLKNFDLNTEKLDHLRAAIGSLAAKIDPLEYWYDYMKKHPQFRKDKLKGEALIAQELYLTEQLVSDVLANATGEIQPSLMEFLYRGSHFKPYLLPEITYATGVDIKVLEAVVAKAKKWFKDPENKNFVIDDDMTALTGVEAQIKEYIQLYGSDRFSLNGVSRPVYMDNTPLDQLDPETRHQVEQMLKDVDKNDPAYESEYQMEVGEAISSRLLSLRHNIYKAVDRVGEKVRHERDRAWREYEDSSRWIKSKENQQDAFLKADALKKQEEEFAKMLAGITLIYCTVCRKKPVPLHQDHSDQQATNEPVCDDCFKTVSEGALSMSSEEWKKATTGEWRCDFCIDPKSGVAPLLYKFAQRNIIGLTTQNNVSIRMQLDYGHATLEAKCRNCKTVQKRSIDWGWVA